jgi:DNA-binding response OmpR family regulator
MHLKDNGMAKILIIDDDINVRGMLSQLLKKQGHFIQTADDGINGLSCQMKKPSDIIILDMFMPRKDGFETILELKAINTKSTIIAITGGTDYYGEEEHAKACKALGIEWTFVKPLDLNEILNAIETIAEDE